MPASFAVGLDTKFVQNTAFCVVLAEDLRDGQVVAGVRVVSPFLNAPEKVLD